MTVLLQDFEKVDVRVGRIIAADDFPRGGFKFLIS